MHARLLCDDPELIRQPQLLATRVAGIPLLRRHFLAFSQAGIDSVEIEVPSDILPEVQRLAHEYVVPGMEVHVVCGDSASQRTHQAPEIAQSATTVVDPRLVAELVQLAAEGREDVRCLDRAAAVDDFQAKSPYVVGVPEGNEVTRVSRVEARRLVPIGLDVHAGTTADARPAGVDIGRYYWHRVSNVQEARTATWKVLLATMKATDGIYARTNRRVSLRISRVLLPTPVTANMMTVATLGCGLLAGFLLAEGDYPAIVAGSLMGWFASMLDGVDGELARAKFQATALGHWLEMICDYVFYMALAIGLGVGFSHVTGERVWLVLGIAAALGVVFSFTAVAHLKYEHARRGAVTDFYAAYQRSVAAPASNPFMRVTPHLTALMTRAAFPYFFVAFAVLGLAKVVLVLFFVATQSFWMVALYASRLKVAAEG